MESDNKQEPELPKLIQYYNSFCLSVSRKSEQLAREHNLRRIGAISGSTCLGALVTGLLIYCLPGTSGNDGLLAAGIGSVVGGVASRLYDPYPNNPESKNR